MLPVRKYLGRSLAFAGLLLCCLLSMGCKGQCYWEHGHRVWPTGRQATSVASERYVGALVTANTVSVTAVSARHNDSPVALDNAVSSAYQTQLTNELTNRGLYNPSTQSVVFYRTTNTGSIAVGDCGAISVSLNNGQQPGGTLVGLGSVESDFNDGGGLTRADVTQDDLSVSPSPIGDCFVNAPVAFPGVLAVSALFITGIALVHMRRRQQGRRRVVPG
jgi:hypothetical protein